MGIRTDMTDLGTACQAEPITDPDQEAMADIQISSYVIDVTC